MSERRETLSQREIWALILGRNRESKEIFLHLLVLKWLQLKIILGQTGKFWGGKFWFPSLTSKTSTVRHYFQSYPQPLNFWTFFSVKCFTYCLEPLFPWTYTPTCLSVYNTIPSIFFLSNVTHPSAKTQINFPILMSPWTSSLIRWLLLTILVFSYWGINWTIYHLVLQIFSGGSNSHINLLLFNFSHFAPFCLFSLNSASLPCCLYPEVLLSKVWAKNNLHQNPPEC